MNRIIAILLLFLYTTTIFAQTNPSKGSAVAQTLVGNELLTRGSVEIAMSSSDYMVTAGDIYSLNFAIGSNPVSYTISVDSSYKIRIANLAVIDASGMSFIKLKRQVEDIVTKNYPMSAVQFALIKPATFEVLLVGEVTSTTKKQVWALTNLSEILDGNLTSYASRRIITVTSQSGNKKTYDLFLASRFGNLSQDPYLRPGDVITIGRAERFVSVDGAVERPGRYELLPGENFKELLEYYANGFTPYADPSKIEIRRTHGFTSQDKKEEILYWDNSTLKENKELINHDTVFVPSYTNLRSVVFVEGAITSADTVESTQTKDGKTVIETMSSKPMESSRVVIPFVQGTSYSSFLRKNKSLLTSVSDTDNAYIVRKGEVIPLNATKILFDSGYKEDLLMEPNDVVCIPFQSFKVTVSGSVKNPGTYSYVPNRTYEYYISLAGGFVTSENIGDSIIITDVDGNRVNKTDIIPPDSAIIAKTNSFLYWWNQYAPIITTIGAVLTATGAVITSWQALK